MKRKGRKATKGRRTTEREEETTRGGAIANTRRRVKKLSPPNHKEKPKTERVGVGGVG